MPRVVDADARRRAIAKAALSIARAEGLAAVSFRTVAKAMGARSTTVVSHYAPTRRALIDLMFAELFRGLQDATDQMLPKLDPVDALVMLGEGVLPLSPETRVIAQLGLDAALEFGAKDGFGEGLESWGDWLQNRVGELVAEIGSPLGNDVATDAIIGSLAGITFYGLVDPEGWPAERQRAALRGLLAALCLTAVTLAPRRRTSVSVDDVR